uniref:Uncharacterized protein n=1 Tax=Aureoumbra lagunensis TaxID=44058 RepID=A0A7S3NIM7_9STRA
MGEVLRETTIKALKAERDAAQIEARARTSEAKRAREENERLKEEAALAVRTSSQLASKLRTVEETLEICRLDLEAAELEREEAQELLEIEKDRSKFTLVFEKSFGKEDLGIQSEEALLKVLIALREAGTAETAAWRERCQAAEAVGACLQVQVSHFAKLSIELQDLQETKKDHAFSKALIERLTLDKTRLEEKLQRATAVAGEAQIIAETRDELEELLEVEIKDLMGEICAWQKKYNYANDRANRVEVLAQQIDQTTCDLLHLARTATENCAQAQRRAEIAQTEAVATKRAWNLEQRRFTKLLRLTAAPITGLDAMISVALDIVQNGSIESHALQQAADDARCVLALGAILRGRSIDGAKDALIEVASRFGFEQNKAIQALPLLVSIAAAEHIDTMQGPEAVRDLRKALATYLWLDAQVDRSLLDSTLAKAQRTIETRSINIQLTHDIITTAQAILSDEYSEDCCTKLIELIQTLSKHYQRCFQAETLVIVARLAAIGEVCALLAPRQYRGDHFKLREAREQLAQSSKKKAEQNMIILDTALATAAAADARRLATASARDAAALAEYEARQRQELLESKLDELIQTKKQLENELAQSKAQNNHLEADANSLRSALEARDHSVGYANVDRKRRSSSSSKLDALKLQSSSVASPTSDALAQAAFRSLLPPLPQLARANLPITSNASSDTLNKDTIQAVLSELRQLRLKLIQDVDYCNTGAPKTPSSLKSATKQLTDLRRRAGLMMISQ